MKIVWKIIQTFSRIDYPNKNYTSANFEAFWTNLFLNGQKYPTIARRQCCAPHMRCDAAPMQCCAAHKQFLAANM